jgi:type IV pilus assembly protein PilC
MPAMPQFQYEVKKGPGAVTKGTLEAENQRAAVARLRDLGYFPIRVEEAHATEKRKAALQERIGRIRLQDRNLFFRQFANLSESGMVMTRALRTLVEQTENKSLARAIDQLRDDVQKGNTLADSMEKLPKLFPPLYCSLVRAGETGGMLEEVLWRIVAFGEQEEELLGKARSALVYPAFLLLVGSISIFILISFVFPKFVAIFQEFNTDLPLPTRMVMAMCDFMGTWWWAVLIFIGLFISTTISWAKTEGGRRKIDALLLKTPVVRAVVQKYEMAKFARTLGTLLDNGVPVLTALRITASTMSNTLIRDELSAVHLGVTEGASISDTLRGSKHFPPLVVNMFAVGEESGRIGAVAKRVADAYDTEVDRAVKTMTDLFEPMLIVIMGIIVGFLVIAMLLPMMTLSSTIQG